MFDMESEREKDKLASKAGCWIMLLLIFGGLITFITDFWYVFVAILVIIILIYNKRKK